jgi:hypothetical protein
MMQDRDHLTEEEAFALAMTDADEPVPDVPPMSDDLGDIEEDPAEEGETE